MSQSDARSQQAVVTDRKITREDLEAKFRALTADVDDRADAARGTAMAVAAAVGAVLVIGVFLLGRGRGRKSTTVVEVRRF